MEWKKWEKNYFVKWIWKWNGMEMEIIKRSVWSWDGINWIVWWNFQKRGNGKGME